MGRKKNKQVLENVRISAVAAEGMSVARIGNRVLFVPWVMPGDLVDVLVTRVRKNYAEGRVVRFKEESPEKLKPFCRHFTTCGGCRWQHIPYGMQLRFKQEQVEEQLKRIGRVDLPEIRPALPSPEERYYRNKLEYTFSCNRWITRDEAEHGREIDQRNALGFHIPGRFDKVLDIEECFLQPEPSDAIRLFVKDHAIRHGLEFCDLRTHEGFLRNLTIRNNLAGDVMLIFSFCRDEAGPREKLFGALLRAFPSIRSLQYVINNKANDSIYDLDVICHSGEDHLAEEMDGLKYRIGPKSFYQTNTRQALAMYRLVADWACLAGNEVVYDLYSGTGTIGLFLARQAKKVIGIESVAEATADARLNASINGIGNADFFTGDIKDLLQPGFFGTHGPPGLVVLDPPRAGVHARALNSIIQAAPPRIIYVSCNPATQARDLALADEHYRITAVQPVDMFPHTQHVENVVLMEKRK